MTELAALTADALRKTTMDLLTYKANLCREVYPDYLGAEVRREKIEAEWPMYENLPPRLCVLPQFPEGWLSPLYAPGGTNWHRDESIVCCAAELRRAKLYDVDHAQYINVLKFDGLQWSTWNDECTQCVHELLQHHVHKMCNSAAGCCALSVPGPDRGSD